MTIQEGKSKSKEKKKKNPKKKAPRTVKLTREKILSMDKKV